MKECNPTNSICKCIQVDTGIQEVVQGIVDRYNSRINKEFKCVMVDKSYAELVEDADGFSPRFIINTYSRKRKISREDLMDTTNPTQIFRAAIDQVCSDLYMNIIRNNMPDSTYYIRQPLTVDMWRDLDTYDVYISVYTRYRQINDKLGVAIPDRFEECSKSEGEPSK